MSILMNKMMNRAMFRCYCETCPDNDMDNDLQWEDLKIVDGKSYCTVCVQNHRDKRECKHQK